MRAGLAAVLALACSDPPPPAPSPPPATRTRKRLGSTAEGVPGPAAAVSRAACRTPASCTAEVWGGEGLAPLELLREGERMWRPGRRDRWQTGWRGLRGSLSTCLGDPLAIPPAGDPAGFRLLHERDGAWRWSVHLSGANACGISGQLELGATEERVVATGLLVDGQAWAEGGREVAQDRARAHARALAEARWPEADPDERARILAALRKDPDAAALVAELEARP